MPISKSQHPSQPADLDHADWLLRTTKKMIEKVNTNIRLKRTKRGTSKYLVLENITEADLANLNFLTNNDVNNNYLYLEKFEVYTDDDNHKVSLFIPGLTILMSECWNNADSNSFLNGDKTFFPFLDPLIAPTIPGLVTSEPPSTPISVPQFIDIYLSMVPFFKKSYGNVKKFRIVLNPDCASNGGNASPDGCCSGQSENIFGTCTPSGQAWP
jgi:hypothetical protein